MSWWEKLRGRVRLREPLSRHTTMRIGGPVDFFIEPRDRQDLKLLISLAKRYKITLSVIGAGSNILASDKRMRRAAVRLSSAPFCGISFRGSLAEAGSGLMLSRLVGEAAARGFSGAEFLSGIPGTLGGALAMNAGAWGRQISDLVVSVEVMDRSGRIKHLDAKEIVFGYRNSGLEKFLILSAVLKFAKKDKAGIRREIAGYRRQRMAAQDNSFPNAGSVFRNPPGEYAGRLIDLCGLKGASYGSARISSKHANFILNRSGARAADVLKLMSVARHKVKKDFGINLLPEIKIWR